VILVGGVGGGFDSPALRLYDRLTDLLPPAEIGVLRLRYRNSTDLTMAEEDVRTGTRWLVEEQGLPRVGLVGHSFGGAVVVRAAAADQAVAAVVTLAAQGYGTQAAAALGRPVLLIHGLEDPILPPSCSVDLARRVGSSARLRLHEGAGHCLDEVADDVFEEISVFLTESLLLGA
jgi:dienelactone hydrolase